jgi:hypothetical protein
VTLSDRDPVTRKTDHASYFANVSGPGRLERRMNPDYREIAILRAGQRVA